MKKTSISNIAKELKVSPTTVSLVLNGKARKNRISRDIELKVKNLAEKLNYEPNYLARSLRSGRTQTIGVIIADISNSFFSMIAKTIEEESAKFGYKVMFGSTDENPDKFAELLKLFKDRQLDGYIISPSFGTQNQILQLKKDKHHFVLIDRHLPIIKTDYIIVDNYNGAFQAVQHLVNNGYRKIGMLTTLSNNSNFKHRIKAYKDVLRKNNIRVKNSLIREISFMDMKNDVDKEIEDLLLGPNQVEAIFFTSCEIAGYALEKIYKLGIKVPEDLAIVSFDDPSCFKYSFSPITAISQPIDEMGKVAVHRLIEKINNPDKGEQGYKQMVLPTGFVVRESCGYHLKNE